MLFLAACQGGRPVDEEAFYLDESREFFTEQPPLAEPEKKKPEPALAPPSEEAAREGAALAEDILAEIEGGAPPQEKREAAEEPPSSPAYGPSLPAGDMHTLKFIKKYGVTWVGMRVADLVLRFSYEGNNTCHLQAVIESQGLAKLVSGFRSNTLSVIHCPGARLAAASKYRSTFYLRGKRRDISVYYNDDGSISSESVEPSDPEWKRPRVPAELKRGIPDPLTFAARARYRIMETAQEQAAAKFTLPLYDGRRRTDIAFEVIGLTVDRRIHLTIRDIPVAGYTERELERHKERDAVVDVFLDEKTFLPVSGRGYSALGTAKLEFDRDCASLRECLIEAE